jgi:long-subunit acyl-CoA synthetase (AMP-forming)
MGYYKNPDETMKTIDQDGFLHSGDLGRLDKNGILFITGRVK